MEEKNKTHRLRFLSLLLGACLVLSLLTACGLYQDEETASEENTVKSTHIFGQTFDVLGEETTEKGNRISGQTFDALGYRDPDDMEETSEKQTKIVTESTEETAEESTRETTEPESTANPGRWSNTTTQTETTARQPETTRPVIRQTETTAPYTPPTQPVTRETPTAVTQHTHSYSAKVTDATCTNGGYTTHTCAGCGDSYKDSYTPALGHNYVSYTEAEASCYQSGFVSYECTRCGDGYAETIPQKEHNYVVRNIVPATCTNEGYTRYACTECGDTYTGDYTPAVSSTGHTFITQINPDGSVVEYCTVCGYRQLKYNIYGG